MFQFCSWTNLLSILFRIINAKQKLYYLFPCTYLLQITYYRRHFALLIRNQ